MNFDLKILVLAGGVGNRLWPMSTNKKPKQFQSLISNESLLQNTLDRLDFIAPENMYISTNSEYVDLVKAQAPHIRDENIIAEPCLRDTAPCIGLGAAYISKKYPDAVMAVVYADHLIKNTAEFREQILRAAEYAEKHNTLNIIEVRPEEALCNLGYVEIGKELEKGVYELLNFKEKPCKEDAQAFFESGNFLWNTGLYICKVSKIMELFDEHMPESAKILRAIQAGASIEETYHFCEKISIDYGIMEKADKSNFRIFPAELGWSDIGTWAAIQKELGDKENGMLEKGDVMSLDCKNTLIYNESDSPIFAFGMEETIIVRTKTATLICPKSKSHEIKNLLEKAKSNNFHCE